ncbi:hypothetical protein HPB51_025079 [Rhipicephalus microplus]|uniref:Transporter n=1 Tax=Rhipicephalus microplus TaxID=6941 RepID=A0A9J6DK37_RHIMP|nr:hypothetical protein HPB51_025079 [Rhipicephalus microplus]
MEKKTSGPNVFTLAFLGSRNGCRENASAFTAPQAVPICKEAEDNEESSCTTSGLGSQQDLAGVPSRGKWAGKADFIFGCISYAVGLGNVWRFPYLCYENGGGAFLIPYFICLITTAIPMFYLEVAMGQYLSRGGIGIWGIVPMFKGIGIASLTIVTLSNIYYMVIVAWILFYLISSFTEVLPWKHCGNHWNTENCWEYNETHAAPHNKSVSPIVEFWENHVLGISSGLHEIGNMRLELALYLFLSWFIVYVVIWRGLHQSGKIVWVTAIFPYVCLFVLLVRGVTLQGSIDGLLFYVTPDWSQLLKPKFCPSEAIVAGIIDQWPQLITRRKLITFLMVVFQFLLGLPMVTQGGMYLLQLMDNYAVTGITLLFIVFFQAVALSWIYGTSNISDNIKEMLGRRPSALFRLSWSIFIPVMCVAIFLFSVIKYQPIVYAKTYAYPWWGEMLGWFMALASMIMIPAYMIYFLLTTPGSIRERILAGVTPQVAGHSEKEEKEYTFSNRALQP